MGQSPPSSTYNTLGNGIPFFQGTRDFTNRYPKPRVYCTAPTRIAYRGDILLSIRAPIGRVNIANNECAVGRGIAIIRPHQRTDFRYIEYILKNLEQTWRVMEGGGSVFGNATKRDLSELLLYWPAPKVRLSISNSLGALDDKIELNRRMNETLEEMAQACFKSWFVDFDPVRAKMDGRWQPEQSLPGLPAEHYDLFPDRLVSSELGEIPRDWTVVSLSEVISELVSGSRPRGGAVKSGIPSIGAENILGLGLYNYSKEKYIPDDFYAKLEKRGANVRNGDVLLYKDGAHIGRKTYFDCNFPHTKCVVNEHVFIVRLNKPIMQKYLFFWLDQDWVTGKIIGLNSNSAQPGINKSGVVSLPFLVPPLNIIELFEQMVSPLIHSIFTRALESITLSNIRDTLLPKLLSGEIRVDNLENLPANGTETKDAPRPDQ